MRSAIAAFAALVLLAGTALAATPNYVSPTPLTGVINTPVTDCGSGTSIRVPTIAWGADIATSYANGNAKRTAPGSIFATKGLDVSLYRQDNFKQQVDDYMSCKTPFIRATMGMLAQASEVISADSRTKPVVVMQLSWSSGGDVLVVKGGINSPQDLKGKTIAVQAYGPHIDYLLKVLSDAGVSPKSVKIKFTPDLFQNSANASSPALALQSDPTVDAAFVISPDAAALTSGGKTGTGAEGSVRGAHVLLSTKTASRIIADVYVVRSDYFNAHRDQIGKFVSGLFLAEEKLHGLMKARNGDYKKVITAAAVLLLDSPTAINDTVGLYGDMEPTGYPENTKFFGDPSYPRSFEKLTKEIGTSLVSLGLISKAVPLEQAHWDYRALAAGLLDTNVSEAPRFNTAVVQKVANDRAVTTTRSGELFSFQVYFGPNQQGFPADQYGTSFDRVISLASTYGGSLLIIEGNSDPLEYLKRKKAGADAFELQKLRQAAKNLSLQRANAVKDNLIAYARSKGITLDPSQFGVVGNGVSQPNTPKCTHGPDGDITEACAPETESEWNATRRVKFKLIQVEAESSVFKPL